MKQIINGKRYDTEKAENIANAANGCNRDDFNYFDEDLYITKSGQFFLAGQGHAKTKYASKSYDGMRGIGEGIFPLSAAEAQRWLEDNRHTDVLEKYSQYFEIEEA